MAFSHFHVIVVVKLSTWPLGKIYVGNTCPIATDGDDGDDGDDDGDGDGDDGCQDVANTYSIADALLVSACNILD